MTNVSELNVGQGNIDVEGTVTEIGEKRTFNKFGRELSVVNAMLKDDSGSIKLSLWNEDAERFKEGDKIKIVNGYVTEFQGEKQLTAGKFGRIEKAGEGEGGEEKEEEGEEELEEESEKDEEELEEESEKDEESEEEPSEEEDESEEENEPVEEEVF